MIGRKVEEGISRGMYCMGLKEVNSNLKDVLYRTPLLQFLEWSRGGREEEGKRRGGWLRRGEGGGAEEGMGRGEVGRKGGGEDERRRSGEEERWRGREEERWRGGEFEERRRGGDG